MVQCDGNCELFQPRRTFEFELEYRLSSSDDNRNKDQCWTREIESNRGDTARGDYAIILRGGFITKPAAAVASARRFPRHRPIAAEALVHVALLLRLELAAP